MDTLMASTAFITKEQPQGNAGSIAESDVIRVSLELPLYLDTYILSSSTMRHGKFLPYFA